MNKIIRNIIIAVIGSENYKELIFFKRKFLFSSRHKNHYCPCCNSYITDWDSFRENQWSHLYNEELFDADMDKCACPICRSTPRHRVEATWLNERCLEDAKVLLWAPEESMIRYFKTKRQNIITADLYSENVMRKENIEKTSFQDKEFDYIICNHVLEHVTDVMQALNDTYRILKVGGAALFMVPIKEQLEKTIEDPAIISDSDRKKIFGQSDHLRLFGQDFENYLYRAGFDLEKYVGDISCKKEILPIIAPGRYDSNILFVCKKK